MEWNDVSWRGVVCPEVEWCVIERSGMSLGGMICHYTSADCMILHN